jgi:hypothetical protein
MGAGIYDTRQQMPDVNLRSEALVDVIPSINFTRKAELKVFYAGIDIELNVGPETNYATALREGIIKALTSADARVKENWAENDTLTAALYSEDLRDTVKATYQDTVQ